MQLLFIFLLLACWVSAARATCSCDGIVVQGSDQKHCWQVESRGDASWSAADNACVSIGGHMGHPENTTFVTVLNYVKNASDLPVLTGIVAANPNYPLISKMCQANNPYSDMENITGVFANEPSNDTLCSFMFSNSSELVFLACNTTSNVLCDRPLETEDYCSIMANCSSNATTVSTPSTTTGVNISTSLATTTIGSGGQGSDGTCTCPSTSSGSPATTTSSSPSSPSVGGCSEQTGCLKHQWKIFGMCVDWRAMLALIAIGLLLFLCCFICHCCMHACMFCTTKKRDEKIVRDPILPPNRTVVAPIPLAVPNKVDYDVEKSVILPPAAVQPEPVFITVPEKHESVYGFHTKEIIHMMPDRPMMKDVGVQTEPFVTDLPTVVPAPVLKRKKAVKKPKKMYIPANAEPMDSIDEDLAAEIALDLPQSPGAKSVAPLGDIPAPIAPLNFSRNPKPAGPEPIAHDDIPVPPRRGSPGPKPMKSDNDEFDPRGLRSPPNARKGNGNNDEAPRKMTFSPIADDSDEENGARIPSPPRERKSGPSGNEPVAPSPPEPTPKPTLKNKRLNDDAPAPLKSPSRSPAPGGGGGSGTPSNNPFANIGGGGNASPAPFQGGNGGNPNDDVAMRAARGRLGGAVRGGGGGGEAPSGWKPWAKGGARR